MMGISSFSLSLSFFLLCDEESMWGLGFGGGGEVQYPERPGEPDCSYYLRTGTCSYGEKCRYNHPRDRASVRVLLR